MARLLSIEAPGDWSVHGEDIDEYLQRQRENLNALLTESRAATAFGRLEGYVMRFPVGDGHALYRVVQVKPLILQWIPYGDCWRIPAAYIRGLRVSDVVRQQETDRIFDNMRQVSLKEIEVL